MKRLLYIAFFAICTLMACTKEEKPLPSLPVITLDSPSSVYTTKVGREITISPKYENAEQATFAWTSNGKLVGNGPVLSFSSNEKGSYYFVLTVTNNGGEVSEELRIDVAELALPALVLPGAEKGFTILTGTSLKLEPAITSPYDVTCSWTVNGEKVSDEAAYTFTGKESGDYAVALSVANEDGESSISFTIAVRSPEETDFSWSFEQKVYNVSKGRKIRLRAIDIENAFDAEYSWSVDGKSLRQGDSPVLEFQADEEGEHKVILTMRNSYLVASHELTVNVCPPEGTYRRTTSGAAECNRVYEFLPAPGQFINEGYTATTMEQACAWAERRMKERGYVSLGGFGGYMVVGFDHSIPNNGDYDLVITGNSFNESSEPGVIYVMQDENGDGLPNDTWYELKGSEYGKPETDSDYAVTYYRPDAPGQNVPWSDNRGEKGVIGYLAEFHQQDYYYPMWVEQGSYTLRGVRLKSRSYDASGAGEFWVNPPFEWGYADNFSAIDRLTEGDNPNANPTDNHFKISNAVQFDGSPANLAYIDFVKIQVAVNQQCGWIGEVSTEICGVKEYNKK